MVRRLRDNFIWSVCRAVSAALLPLFLSALMGGGAPPVWAQEQDTVLPESGIHYPGGFDANTIGEVRGKAFDPLIPASGPVQFRLASERETYIVLASPKWFWNDLRVDLSEGKEIRVRGSKSLGKDGKLYIIAQELQVLPGGKPLAFRNEDGYPIWKRAAAGTTGGQGGQGGPGSFQGGMGSGGGMGRGKR